MVAWLEHGPVPGIDGVERWSLQDMANKIETTYAVKFSIEGVRKLVNRLGYSPRQMGDRS